MTKYYRVFGLQSAKGQRLNGQACTIHEAESHATPPERVPCWVDGEPDMIAIKRVNLKPLPSNHLTVKLQVKRKSLRTDDDLKFTYQRGDVCGELPRSQKRRFEEIMDEIDDVQGEKKAVGLVSTLFSAVELPATAPLLIMVEDLHLVRAINTFAIERDALYIDHELNEELQSFIAGFSDDFMVLAKFDSPPSPFAFPELPLKKTERGQRRVDTFEKGGSYSIYPCACEEYFDALEVRFGCGGDSEQEIFRDFGPDVSVYYIARTVYSEDDMMLSPKVMANIDPQAFWSAVHYYERFVEELVNFGIDDDIIREWERFENVVRKMRRNSENFFSRCELPDLLPSEQGSWERITSLESHRRISMQCAIAAVILTVTSYYESLSHPKPFREVVKPLTKELLSIYYDTQLEEAIHCIDHYFDFQEGESEYSIITDTFNNDLKTRCCTCNSTLVEELQECSGCGKLAYCSPYCQKKDWPVHRRLCAATRGKPKSEKKKKKSRR